MTYAEAKLHFAEGEFKRCIRLARQWSRQSWELDSLEVRLRNALRKASRQALREARYWKAKM
jgi:hypothetical protein